MLTLEPPLSKDTFPLQPMAKRAAPPRGSMKSDFNKCIKSFDMLLDRQNARDLLRLWSLDFQRFRMRRKFVSKRVGIEFDVLRGAVWVGQLIAILSRS